MIATLGLNEESYEYENVPALVTRSVHPVPPPPVVAAGLVGFTVYEPGTVIESTEVTVLPATVTCTCAGVVNVPPETVNVCVPFV